MGAGSLLSSHSLPSSDFWEDKASLVSTSNCIYLSFNFGAGKLPLFAKPMPKAQLLGIMRQRMTGSSAGRVRTASGR